MSQTPPPHPSTGLSRNSTLVIIPTYNERENLADIIARLLRSVSGVDVLVVDDNSPDGTGALASALASGHDRIHVLHRGDKEGLGAAYRAGFTWGLDQGYERLVEMDADGSHQPEQLDRLLTRLESCDVVLGSRWVHGGSVVNWPMRRSVLSQSGSLYARIALGIPVRDITGGYRAFSAAALRAIGYDTVLSQGYCFQIEMLWRAHGAGLRIAEVPITFVERVYGESKMSSGIVKEAIVRVTRWGLGGVLARLRGKRAGAGPGAGSSAGTGSGAGANVIAIIGARPDAGPDVGPVSVADDGRAAIGHPRAVDLSKDHSNVA